MANSNNTENENQPKETVNVGSATTVNVNKRQPELLLDMYLRIGIPAFFSMVIIFLCAYKIITGENTSPELRAVYWSTLTGTAASWLPSPSKRNGE